MAEQDDDFDVGNLEVPGPALVPYRTRLSIPLEGFRPSRTMRDTIRRILQLAEAKLLAHVGSISNMELVSMHLEWHQNYRDEPILLYVELQPHRSREVPISRPPTPEPAPVNRPRASFVLWGAMAITGAGAVGALFFFLKK